VKLAYSKGGRWDNQDPQGMDVAFTLIPYLNTLSAILRWATYPPIEKKREKSTNINKFFKIKK